MTFRYQSPLCVLKEKAWNNYFESLEARRLFAASIDGRVLTVLGGAGNDTITVARAGLDDVSVNINGTVSQFGTDEFDSVVVSGVGGNDKITIGDDIGSATLSGGSGDDRLIDGNGSNTLLGSDGDDTLVAGTGNDSLSGGGGTDTVDYSDSAAGLAFNLFSFGVGPQITGGGQADTLATFESTEGDDILDTERFVGSELADTFNYTASESDQDTGFPTITMEGGGGNDTFSNGGTFDRFVAIGGAGNDTFDIDAGTSGSAAETTLFGGDGNDIFNFDDDTGPDSLDGGAGTDLITLSSLETPLVVDLNEFTSVENARSARAGVTLIGTPGNNHLQITGGGTIQGGDGNDTLLGSGNPDNESLLGQGGDDLIFGGPGDDTLDGGDGTDTLMGGNGNDALLNGELLDPVQLNAGVLSFQGSDGNEQVSLWRGGEELLVVWFNGVEQQFEIASVASIELDGGGGNDLLKLNPGLAIPATLNGGDGDDKLIGGAGADVLLGGNGNDHMTGNAGDDLLDGGLGADVLRGSTGRDTADYSSRTANLVIGLDGWQDDGEAGENDLAYLDVECVRGGSGSDRLGGSSADNALYGGDGNDTIGGGGGDDALFGEGGNDKVHGDDGDDHVEGGAGHDRIYGNDGSDTLLGLAGNDWLFTAGDGLEDELLGGPGTDRAEVDPFDEVGSVEELV